MKRNLMTLVAVFCYAMTLMAEPVSPSVARQAAEMFLQRKGAVLQTEALRAPRRAMGRTADDQEQTEASPYYVFNAAGDRGFVIVSGDDCVGDNLVLGYSAQGSFDADDIPSGMKWWLDVTATRISELSRRDVKARAVALHGDVEPLVTALWDQGSSAFNPENPYNAFCPETDGLLCITGCMATALSQVLYYHRWPQGPLSGELPAYSTEHGLDVEALPATTFDWDNMVDDYWQPTSDVQQKAVAKLMRYCGQLVQMDYTPQVSNGYYYDIDLLVSLFGYDQGVYIACADNYTVSGWDELLYQELSEGRPLPYLGMSTGGGHAFVIDGYQVQDGSGYYHVNWGWSGDGNGFYKISLLNPDMSGAGGSSTSDGYNFTQMALIGLQPAKQPAEAYGRYLAGLSMKIYKEETPHSFPVVNTSYMPGTFDIALAERQADGTADCNRLVGSKTMEVAGYNYAEFNTEAHTGMRLITLSEINTEGLAAGHHELVFVNKEAGTDAPWRPIYGPNRYIELNIGDDGQATDTIYHPLPQLTASVRTIKIEGLKQRGIRQTVTATITNNSDDDFIGSLDCTVYYLENNKLQYRASFSRTGIMIEANSKSDLTFTPSAPQAGTFVLVLSIDGEDLTGTALTKVKNTKGYIGHKSFTVDELAFYCQEFGYNERTDDEGHPVYCLDVTLANNTPMDYDAVLLANLYKPNSQGVYEPVVFPGTSYIYSRVALENNRRLTTSIYLPEALDPGDYYIELLIANDFKSLIPTDYFVFAGGLFTVSSPTAVISVDKGISDVGDGHAVWFSLDGRKLGGRPTAKGVYIHQGKKYMVK